jgi:hypothetical protein
MKEERDALMTHTRPLLRLVLKERQVELVEVDMHRVLWKNKLLNMKK